MITNKMELVVGGTAFLLDDGAQTVAL